MERLSPERSTGVALRNSVRLNGGSNLGSSDVARAMTVGVLLDDLGMRLNGPAAAEHTLRLNLTVTDRRERWFVGVEQGALHRHHGPPR